MVTKISLDSHPSVVMAFSPEAGRLLMSVYDDTYPRVVYRLSANNIGGNPEQGDICPESVLLNEISEEFDPNHPMEKRFFKDAIWASDEDIRFIRNGLLGNLVPFQDFYMVAGEVPGGSFGVGPG